MSRSTVRAMTTLIKNGCGWSFYASVIEACAPVPPGMEQGQDGLWRRVAGTLLPFSFFIARTQAALSGTSPSATHQPPPPHAPTWAARVATRSRTAGSAAEQGDETWPPSDTVGELRKMPGRVCVLASERH